MADAEMAPRQSAGRVSSWCLLLPHYGLHAGAVGLVALYLWPYWVLGQDAHVLVHDQLDSVFVSLKILTESGLLFAHPDTPILAMGNDVTRASYPSPLYGVVWLFMVFGSFKGYVATQLIIRLVAYWGMYRLLSCHCLKAKEYRLPAALSALAFACLPYYSLFGLSVAGQPLFFSSLLAIRAGQGKPVDWAVCALFPAWSLLALGGLFTMAIGGLIWCADVVARRQGARRLFWALALTTVLTLVVEYQMVMVTLGLADGFVSHRTEFRFNAKDISAALGDAWYNFYDGQYHAASLQRAVVFPSAVVALTLAAWGRGGLLRQTGAIRRWPLSAASAATVVALVVLLAALMWESSWMWEGAWMRKSSRMSPVLLGGFVMALGVLMPIVAMILTSRNSCRGSEGLVRRPATLLVWSLTAALTFSLWYALWPLVWAGVSAVAPNVPYLNLSRFHYLHPMLWSMVLAAALAVLLRQGRVVGAAAVALVVILQAATLFMASEHRHSEAVGDPTFREFFSPELFIDLKRALAPEERISAVVSIGLHPAIAAYNGLRTLDGYLANYPLSNKRAFRDLIADELARDQNYQRYFDDWGSRFYIFSHDLASVGTVNYDFALSKKIVLEKDIQLRNLHLNSRAFAAMGGSHVLSAVAIGNAQDLGLELVTVAEHPASPWRLYVYRVAGKLADQQLP